jgi:DNA processing protein
MNLNKEQSEFKNTTDNSNKAKLWFLETHLTQSELRLIKCLYGKKMINFEIESLLKKILVIDKDTLPRSCHAKQKNNYERYALLMNSFDRFQNHFDDKQTKIVTRMEIESLLQKNIHMDAPLALQYEGQLDILKKPLVAIIGSRKPTYYGREQSYRFAKELAQKGCAILSGGAIGIDSIANAVGMEKEGGSCAILGSGLNNLYPPSNKTLFQKLKHHNQGLLLSQFLENEPPQKWNFPKRNHTLAQLADFVLIIEATQTSGSLITANAALDFGTDVGAIPGCIDSINSIGTNYLIQRGGFCIQTPQDVFERVDYIYKQRMMNFLC